MNKTVKESKPFSLRMDKVTFERLAEFCDKYGQTKTVAVERAINMYIDDYESKMKKLEESS